MDPQRSTNEHHDKGGSRLESSQDVALTLPAAGNTARPPIVKHMSAPAYQSPLRHHHRAPSKTRNVKETLNARSEYSHSDDDGPAQHRINQYVIKQEIGRGSFGAVHLAVDQYGQEYAVKEFSKSRLRKRAQSSLLRRPERRSNKIPPSSEHKPCLNPQNHLHAGNHDANPLDLIREEIAIMKKLNHPNLASLIEVLDDPKEDSLYMVMEYCKKGVVMKVGIDQKADPYAEETCRCWFRDMILGVEYLHAQGILHRDIKPDNCLITEDDVLKIVDFGVSEMFKKESDMNTAKSAGSPAFMPPELCVAKHGHISGRAADIWSMGVTLFCLRYGRIPFEKSNVLELYESIRTDPMELVDENNSAFRDLMYKILEKDAHKRIKMDELREHPWVTKGGEDPLLSKEENTAEILDPPTEAELNAAITGNMKYLVFVMRAVKKFKALLFKRRPELMEGIFGRDSRIVQPPLSMRPVEAMHKSKSVDTDDRRAIESALTIEGVHRDIVVSDDLRRLPEQMDHTAITIEQKDRNRHMDIAWPKNLPQDRNNATDSPKDRPQGKNTENGRHRHNTSGRGQAHDPLSEIHFLDIGAGVEGLASAQEGIHIVSESPSAIEINIFQKAYEEEVEKILREKGKQATIYLTRRVEGNAPK